MKRQFKKVLIFSVIGLLIVAFWKYTDPDRNPLDQGRVLIRFWNGFTGPDGRAIVRLVRQFNEEHPDIHVQLQRIDWNTYYNKVFVAGLGGRAPDVFVVHASLLPRFVRSGLAAPLDEMIQGTNGLPENDFDERVSRAVRLNGRQWGVPLDVHLLGMYCNRTLFRQAGLTNSVGDVLIPQTRGALMTALRRLTRDFNGDGTPDQWGCALTSLRMIFQSLMTQFNGSLVSPDGKTCLIDSPENRQVMTFFYNLVYRDRVCPPTMAGDSWSGFRKGRVGVVFEGGWMLSQLEKSNLDYVGVPFPQIGEHPGVWADSHVMCLSKTSGDRQQEAGWELIRYLSDHSLEWAETGQIPVRKSLRETEKFKSMKVQNAFARLIPYVYFTPAVPYKLELDTEVELAVEKVLRGTVMPAEALRTADRNIMKIINRIDQESSGQEND